MSYTYCLVCIESKQVLDLGKIICLDEDGKELPWSLSGIGRVLPNGDRPNLAEAWKMMEHFLILNRCKEIRLIPSDLLAMIDPDYSKFQFIDEYEEFMAIPIDPIPDYMDEINNISDEVRTRLIS